jgi:uncharacterized protein
MHRPDIRSLLGRKLPIIGMVHLRALPGAPAHLGMEDVLERARVDAEVLTAGGVDAIMIENFGDTPFFPDVVPPETIAALTRAVTEVRAVTKLPLGVNVLRNDARAALAIAAATGAAFIRVNVHTGAMLTDQGWIASRAHETLRARAALAPAVAIMADVMVKHATPPAGLTIGDAARDTWLRGMADALIVSGAATGAAADPDRVLAVRRAIPDAPIFLGSGISAENAATLLQHADGAIVGSALQHDGKAGQPVDAARVEQLMDAVRRIRNEHSRG